MNARTLADAGVPDLSWFSADQATPLVFATISGAHLYGFPSVDSDVDIRGVHLLGLRDVVGLRAPTETVTRMWERDRLEIDLVTHDLAKFARLMVRRNGYVLEQLLSSLVVTTRDAHAEMVALAPLCLTRFHARHYLGFADTQGRLFAKTDEIKPLLYTFRALLTGTHLMRSGEVEAHLPSLLERVDAPSYLPELIEAKRRGEHRLRADAEGAPQIDVVERDMAALFGVLESAAESTALPDSPTAEPALHDLVVRVRLEGA